MNVPGSFTIFPNLSVISSSFLTEIVKVLSFLGSNLNAELLQKPSSSISPDPTSCTREWSTSTPSLSLITTWRVPNFFTHFVASNVIKTAFTFPPTLPLRLMGGLVRLSLRTLISRPGLVVSRENIKASPHSTSYPPPSFTPSFMKTLYSPSTFARMLHSYCPYCS